MAVRTRAELATLAGTIKNETVAGANTATRVGSLLGDLADTLATEYLAFSASTIRPDTGQRYLLPGIGQGTAGTLGASVTLLSPITRTFARLWVRHQVATEQAITYVLQINGSDSATIVIPAGSTTPLEAAGPFAIAFGDSLRVREQAAASITTSSVGVYAFLL